ncbi:CTP synthase [Candidatus Roizmanbacteria bacterium RIFCSPHIGHO2_02_FULL_37_13b]|uniref:CTP synthase (glutamine hydrolyzing) n=1 Tax=Candidatus Roizmanbacteria bacterium RIFCSPLOWO2_02_FULL_36_11 TaxID=1802071 RepID=A0A1F7JI15_9BACT|nr:MAG: CTP synthase [Candidatus Roizmanbacteria bacterium RIFCSPHIGHO2_02_FULL_37_13b]OGK55232.1 MAG: CTP synthase [Candidatus Roizmanbacteria bacterium RIFCSPLOWO2_02_FULL_36_11]
MQHKYIFVSGGVISGLGKGITTAAISLLLKSTGLKVVPIKCENYLNIDAGTINPIEHGDPFLCDDGTESDMDIGSYEKFLNSNMSKLNFVTMGQIYKTVIDRERRFEYDGEDVEAIPHITDEIIRRINEAIDQSKADIAVIELGGTVGEYQNIFYYEASRILTLKNPTDVIHIHVSYLPTPKHLGEPKTKPTQLSVKTLNSLGIQPDFLITRSEVEVDKRRRDRFSLFCNMQADNIISSPDVKSIYEIPLIFEKQGLVEKIIKRLHLTPKKTHLDSWIKFVNRIKEPKKNKATINIVGKYFSTGNYQIRDSYAALFDAIDHAAWQQNCSVTINWIDAEKMEKMPSESLLQDADGIIVPIGWGIRGAQGMIKAASYARAKKIPYLGLCYGMQLAVVAYARDVLNLKDANTTENDNNTKNPVIHLIPHQKELLKRRAYGGTMRLGSWQAIVSTNTYAFEIYHKYGGFINEKKGLTSERHRHRYEFNNDYLSSFEKAGLIISAKSVVENLAEIIELPRVDHPFYIGTQGHPEYKSRPLQPHPFFLEFINACIKQAQMI